MVETVTPDQTQELFQREYRKAWVRRSRSDKALAAAQREAETAEAEFQAWSVLLGGTPLGNVREAEYEIRNRLGDAVGEFSAARIQDNHIADRIQTLKNYVDEKYADANFTPWEESFVDLYLHYSYVGGWRKVLRAFYADDVVAFVDDYAEQAGLVRKA